MTTPTQRSEFLDRVLQRVPEPQKIDTYFFSHWNVAGKPVDEGVGLLPVPGADPEKVLDRVFDVNNYKANIVHVDECRAIEDPRFRPPEQLRFYQRITIPILGKVHHEIVLNRIGEVDLGYTVAFWFMLEQETADLDKRTGARNQFSDGAWLVAPGIVGYALSSCVRREDVGFLKWKALTTGADVAASKVIRDNIEAMSAWAARL